MQESVHDVVERVGRASHAGEIHFGQVVAQLMVVGVQSYHADYRHGSTTYYLPGDATQVRELHKPDVAIADGFDAAAVQAAIRGAQRGEVMYPEFVRLTMAAGCAGYIVWLDGRHVSYYGRRGETHVERFPS